MALVQQSSELLLDSTPGSGSLTFASNTTAGNLVVLVCFNVDGTAHTFTSTGFTKDVYRANNDSGGSVAILSQADIAGGVNSYTVSFANSTKCRVIGYEFDSVATASYVEASSSNGGNTLGGDMYAAPSGSIDTTQGGPIVVAHIADRTPASWSGPTGWTGSGTRCTASGTTALQGYTNYKIASGASTDERGACANSGANYDGVIVAYKAAAGAAPTLSSGSVTGVTAAGATLNATSTASTGTAYAVMTASSTPPTAAQVKAGQDNGGSAADGTGSASVSSTSVSVTISNSDTGVTRYGFLVHEDSNGLSNVLSLGAIFTGAPTYPITSEVYV